jgi:hypothetical protein
MDRKMQVWRSNAMKSWQEAAMVVFYKTIKAAQAAVQTPLRGSQFESPRLCRGMVTETSGVRFPPQPISHPLHTACVSSAQGL